MNWKSIVMLLSTLFGGREKMIGGRDASPETAKSSFISGDAKFQIPQAYVPPNPVKYPDDYCVNFNENDEFDFVVVGSGPGGSTVARRLAEDPKVKVLLIEAGGDPPPQTDIPVNIGKVAPEEMWHFHTVESEKMCEGVEFPGCPYLFGKVLGGNTIINGMNFVRGNHKDYDGWAEIGCKGWSYKEVLPYFKKSERFTRFPLLTTEEVKKSKNPNVADKKYHGTDGPLHHTSFQDDPYTTGIREAIIQAQVEIGIKYNADVNGADQMGVTNFGAFVDPLGYRNSAPKAYLLNIPDNLKVCKYSMAMTLELDEKTVTGVNFNYNGTGESKNYKAKAKREYIISAGPFNSAPLLERSGIGRRDVLEELGIEVKHELPGVGENYQDHFTSGLLFSADFLSEASPNPMSTPLSFFATFYNTSDPKSSVPDITIIALTFEPEGMTKAVTDQLNGIIAKGRQLFFMNVGSLTHPNPGSVHITQTEDPTITPKIITNHLTLDFEKERFVKGTHLARKFMSRDVLKPFKVEPVVLEECQKFEFNSEDEIFCQKRLFGFPFHHVVGPTSMGPRDNPNSVVDPELRVIGIENLRVCDSGIMPLVPRAHTTTPTIMIGEKAADMIKDFWK